MHDMWAFCGAEHFSYNSRWRDGYTKDNMSCDERGLDLNLWTWNRKKKNWKKPFQLIPTSSWLKECIEDSELMKSWPINLIHTPIDTIKWKPFNKLEAKKNVGFADNKPILIFCAHDGTASHHKGFDLLIKALINLHSEIDFNLGIVGQSSPENPIECTFDVIYLGHIFDEEKLMKIFSAADIVVVPSRVETFGQVAAEAHACATPVVSFDIGGLRDIIEHKKTGYLAKPFDTKDFANGIKWTLNNNTLENNLSLQSRKRVENFFSYKVIAQKYYQVFMDNLS